MTDITGDIERELDRTLPTDDALLAGLREPLDTDHWYGELSLHVHDALADARHDGAPAAAAGVECLRAYARLRGRVLVQLNDDVAHSFTADPTRALLASDHLYAAAYAALGRSGGPAELFGAVTRVSQRIAAAFSARYTEDSRDVPDPGSLVDDTTGALGEAAATVGAILADATPAQRDAASALGRGLGALESIRRTDDTAPGDRHVVLPDVDESRLDAYAETRRGDVRRALTDLAADADVSALRALVPE
ncbi:polyprenyl synthetase [Salarchaeum japonicum]|uniref:Polyprenyl synthetase n=1 Tax=Salarchaeum japonicum TaxID=555573 RepID=A0AAV3T1F1_9EURY|nr:polyprenyl synthetase [Salarchaeum japonicum]